MSAAVESAFQSLFYGEGSYLGLLLMVLLCDAPVFKWPLIGVLCVPISLLVSVSYLTNTLNLHALVMAFNAVFIVYVLSKKV